MIQVPFIYAKSIDFVPGIKNVIAFQLTSNRIPPPRRRRGQRPERKTQSENIDELLKQRSNELMINDINKQKTMAKAENPLLVRVKNERMIKSLDDLDSVDDIESPGGQQIPPKLPPTSPTPKTNGESGVSKVN